MGPQRFLERGTDLIIFDRYIGELDEPTSAISYRFCIVASSWQTLMEKIIKEKAAWVATHGNDVYIQIELVISEGFDSKGLACAC